MCPDPQLLSTYMDGEMPSPWKEKLEKHLTECSGCRKKYENFTLLRELYKKPEREAEKREQLAQSRVWRNLSAGQRRPAAVKLWQRRLSIPLPVAAAAAAVILLIAGLWLRGVQPNNNGMASSGQTPSMEMAGFSFTAEGDIPVVMPDTDLNSILQFLFSDGSDTTVIILPESRNFYRTGEPGAVKAADYQRGR